MTKFVQFCAHYWPTKRKFLYLCTATETIDMKLFSNPDFSAAERQVFLSDYRILYRLVGDKIPPREWALIRAYIIKGVEAGLYARDEHGVQLLLHAMETTRVLTTMIGLGRRSVLTVLLYPLAAHDVISRKEVTDDFGEEVAQLMSSMGKVKRLNAHQDSLRDENFSELMISFAQDIRVIICMICDCYVLMRMLADTTDVEYRRRVTTKSRLLYTPIAHRLGLYIIKGEMEDMAVKYDYPDVYADIDRQLTGTKDAREAYIRSFIAPLEQRLREVLHVPFHIKGRTKSIASIWTKLKRQQKRVDQIYDVFAIRIIIDADATTTAENGQYAPLTPSPNLEQQAKSRELSWCWQAYSVVSDLYVANTARMKDWLSMPKSNGYESLHVTVKGPDDQWVEVQIRTKRMDDIAERGLAAHWKYKGIKSQGTADQIMASIREVLESGEPKGELMRDFSMGLYEEEVFVFTPNGDVHKFPKGATVLDFAFGIHSRLGMQCVGARVGGKNVKINYPLHSGETIEVLTSTQQSPKLDWLNIVRTSKARQRIKQALKEIENREALMAKEMLQRRFKNRKVEIDESEMSRVISRLGYKNQTTFYQALSHGDVTVDEVLQEYDQMQAPVQPAGQTPAAHSAEDFVSPDAPQPQTNDHGDVLVIDRNLRGIDYKLAGCCHPIYGDDVIGFVSVSRGITIHRADCPNIRCLQQQHPYRIQRARWSGKSGGQYNITLRVVGNDDIGIVTNISSVINKEPNTLLRSISIDAEGGLFQGQLTVCVSDLSSLNLLIRKIQNVRGVKNVVRTN